MVLRWLFPLLFLPALPSFAAGVKVLFDPAAPEVGPFPTDYLTAPSTTTRTAKRVRLPMPSDCSAQPNACQEAFLLNSFDGFNIHARVTVRFSAPINLESLRDGVYLIAADSYSKDEKGVHKSGDIIRLNRFTFDPQTNSAYGKPDGPMDQSRRYLLVVTDAVKDAAGDPVEADSAFTSCAAEAAPTGYCQDLTTALKDLKDAKPVAASLFTTMSVTAWMEAARDALNNTPPILSRPAGQSFFPFNELNTVTWRRQVRTQGSALDDLSLPVSALQGSVSALAFGAYTSPNYLRADRTIGDDPTTPASVEQVEFNALLPTGTKPAKGYPVAIFGHGLSDSRFGGPSAASFGLGARGIAMIAISAVGHGYGPNSVFQIRQPNGNVINVPAPGRGIDINRDGRIDDSEGCADVPSSPLGLRDCMRQTVVDLLQLVRLIRAGLDIDGDGTPDFDPDRIFYAGHSLGAMQGVMLLALEPNIQRGFLNSGGGSIVDVSRWSRSYQSNAAQTLSLRQPALVSRNSTTFDENYVLRNEPVRAASTPGAIPIQNALETLEWLQAEGDPASYAAHLKTSPLKGVPEKAVMWQYGLGDQTVPNNTQTALVRYADMKSSTWIYRHDKAVKVSLTLPPDPHTFLVNILPAAFFLTQAAQGQMVSFLLDQNFDPNAGISFFYGTVFEQPEELPETLNYLEP